MGSAAGAEMNQPGDEPVAALQEAVQQAGARNRHLQVALGGGTAGMLLMVSFGSAWVQHQPSPHDRVSRAFIVWGSTLAIGAAPVVAVVAAALHRAARCAR